MARKTYLKNKLYISLIYDIFGLILGKVILGLIIVPALFSAGIALAILIPLSMVIFFIYDAFGVFLAVKLYGNIGWWQMWEIFEVTNQIDGFIPTLSILYWYNKNKK